MLNLTDRNEIIFHFNKKHLEDNKIPMWTIKTKGETYYVHHLISEIGFSTKETPDGKTKGSLKFKGAIRIEKDDEDRLIATIYDNQRNTK